jgi:dihydroorotase
LGTSAGSDGVVIVTGGRVVTSAGIRALDILCERGRIVGLLDPAANGTRRADDAIDAKGRLIFPGFIDPHVHSREPGLTYKEDFAHATLGALTGGTTTILEMPNAIPPVDSLEAFEVRRMEHEPNAWVDFGLWGLAIGEENLHQLGPLLRAGVVGVKLFWGYALDRDTRQLLYNFSGDASEDVIAPPDNGVVLEVFRAVAAENGLLAAHCEDRQVNLRSAQRLGHEIETYEDLLASRPAAAEATAIALGAEFADITGCRFHVVHLSSALGLRAVRAARARGSHVTAETCPHYLTFTSADYEQVGPQMKVYPPIRDQPDQDALWDGVNDGSISFIGSDHAPHTVEEKGAPLRTQPAGAVGAETFGPVMIDALLRNKLAAPQFLKVMSENAARIFGVYPEKGTIRLGSDADLVMVDPGATSLVRNEDLRAKQPITPWNGVALRGRVSAVMLRGRLVFSDGEVIGPRRGRFVRPSQRANEAYTE